MSSRATRKVVAETHSLDSLALLHGHTNGLSSRRQGGIVIGVLAQQVEKLVGVCRNQLCQLRVASTELLQDRLQHLRLLLNNLAELLKLCIAAQEIEVTESTLGACTGCSSTTGSTTRATSSSGGSEIKQVDRAVVIAALGNGLGGGLGRGGRCACSRGCLLSILGNTLKLSPLV